MKNDKYGFRDVFYVKLYDQYGSKVTELSTLTRAKLRVYANKAVLQVRDPLLDENLLGFISGQDTKQNNITDFALERNSTLINFKAKGEIECKIIAYSYIRHYQTGEDQKIAFIMNNCKVDRQFDFCGQFEGPPSTFNISFEIMPDESGNLFQLKM